MLHLHFYVVPYFLFLQFYFLLLIFLIFLYTISTIYMRTCSLSQHHRQHRRRRQFTRWDPENLRFSDKSQKAIDLLRVKCLKLRCMVLSDGRYYELVKANFERADRMTVVRQMTCCRVSPYYLIQNYNDLIFNWTTLSKLMMSWLHLLTIIIIVPTIYYCCTHTHIWWMSLFIYSIKRVYRFAKTWLLMAVSDGKFILMAIILC